MASDYSVLRKRLRRLLFQNKRPDRPELHSVILPMLSKVGRLALVGGAIRDIALRGGDNFRSDLDFVLFDGDLTAFNKLMLSLNAVPNRFGGYGVRFARWKVDIWALENTWARTAGHRQVEQISDLVECTFFNWDAAVFDLTDDTLYTRKHYLSTLQKGILEVNLLANPNPKGSLVRALRRGRLWNTYFGEQLTDFTREEIRRHSWDELLRIETTAFRHSSLAAFDYHQLLENLDRQYWLEGQLVTKPFGADPRQLEFDLG
ncbi:hypothetical protein EOD00_20310 [Mesorhizobium sp. M7A.T.Ca.TU.009.01.3.1]|nr:hypothetical protein EOD00_20310 [Mesorhizobium sp. M7A.T.Ca.TU.009.01.3.1]